MTNLHDSTLALSVYTALQRFGALSREQTLSVLQQHWMPVVEPAEIDSGAAYLARRNMITETDGVLTPTRFKGGAAATVVRSADNLGELVYGAQQ